MKPKNITKALIFTACVMGILYTSGGIARMIYELIINWIHKMNSEEEDFIPEKVYRFVVNLASILVLIYLFGRVAFTLLELC